MVPTDMDGIADGEFGEQSIISVVSDRRFTFGKALGASSEFIAI